MIKKLSIVLLLCGLSVTTFSQNVSETKVGKIKKLLELTGAGSLGVQAANSMIALFQQSYSDVDQKFWDDFAKEIKAEDLVNFIIPIYDKYYSEEDIDQLIVFYNSPVGKKSTQVLPMITQESMAAGQVWGKQLAEKVVKQLKEKGYSKE